MRRYLEALLGLRIAQAGVGQVQRKLNARFSAAMRTVLSWRKVIAKLAREARFHSLKCRNKVGRCKLHPCS